MTTFLPPVPPVQPSWPPPGRAMPPDVRLAEGAWCPLDDTVLQLDLTGWWCPSCGGAWDHQGRRGWWLTRSADLGARLRAEDDLQRAGLLAVWARATCALCRVWITDTHQASNTHLAAVETEQARITAQELFGVACTVPVPGGPVDGMCWQPRPCGVHGERVDTVARLRRADRALAAMVGAGLVAWLGYDTAGLLRPWMTQVPDQVVWALFTVLLVAGFGYAGVVLTLWGLDEHRHTGLALGVPDERR